MPFKKSISGRRWCPVWLARCLKASRRLSRTLCKDNFKDATSCVVPVDWILDDGTSSSESDSYSIRDCKDIGMMMEKAKTLNLKKNGSLRKTRLEILIAPPVTFVHNDGLMKNNMDFPPLAISRNWESGMVLPPRITSICVSMRKLPTDIEWYYLTSSVSQIESKLLDFMDVDVV